MDPRLQSFLNATRKVMSEFVSPADIVLETAPHMAELLRHAPEILTAEHKQGSPEGYARNPVFEDPDGTLSLFCMVWSPGQWTPVHDHGTWGVVGIAEGMLEERNFIRTDPCTREDSGIVLRRGGMTLLSPGTVTSFVPNPDHIHRTGVPLGRETAVSLHVYGRHMHHYNVYDLELGRRYPVDISPEALKSAPGV